MPDYLIHTIGIVSFVAAIVATWGLIRNRPRATSGASLSFPPVSEWKSTGHIDFASPRHEIEVPQKSPLSEGAFLLRVEEYRIVQCGEDDERIEFRWRNATVQEARRVAAQYNSSVAVMDVRLPLAAAAPPLAPLDAALTSTEALDR